MTADPSTRIDDGTDLGRQWIVNLVPPALILVDLQLGYMLVPYACRTGDSTPGHVVHLIMLLACLGLAAVAWRSWTEAGRAVPSDDGSQAGRSRFMAVLGILISVSSALVIAAQWWPSFLIHPCQ